MVRTGPGSPCGDLMRRYWQPVALSEELQADVPLEVRILSEDLVLFRDAEGKPGLVGKLCPHRCADLSYGRVENNGLRCLYHGWLFSKEGRCLEQPAEPPESKYKDEIRHTAYPCVEAGGMILTYMGPGEAPLVPNMHFLTAGPKNVWTTKVWHECNYLQGNEGNLDPQHLSILHAQAFGRDGRKGQQIEMYKVMAAQRRPKIEVERTRFGIRMHSTRDAGEGKTYLRTTNFVLPNLGFFSGEGGGYGAGYSVHWHVPCDDATHWRYDIYYEPQGVNLARIKEKQGAEMNGYYPARTKANRYMQDRDEIRRGDTFAGMGSWFPSHDLFAVETCGAIHDRSKEHLATSDVAIVAGRRALLNAIRDVREGREPPMVLRDPTQNVFNDLVVLAEMVEKGVDPKDFCADLIKTKDFHAIPAE
jgi:phenylpropionate dioxygenase-like ring-hydroxylating dioxygenase large terminal subunit